MINKQRPIDRRICPVGLFLIPNKNLKDFYCRTNAKAFVTQNESIKDFI